uniref:gastrokine-1-like n=1 Tax=Euleptes europaea TaxID=460621 RepID=UPI002541C47E|nr:gastrokine-1-like [Euleptes europaea]
MFTVTCKQVYYFKPLVYQGQASSLIGSSYPESQEEVIDVSNQRNVDSYTHQTVNVNQQDEIANIHNYNGWNGWDAIWDYRKGLFATRLFRKRACVVATMDLKTFPRLETLSSSRGDKPEKNIPLAHGSRFSIGKTHVKNIAQFGYAIEQLCEGIPTYYAYQEQAKKHFSSTIEVAANVWEDVKVVNSGIIITCGSK